MAKPISLCKEAFATEFMHGHNRQGFVRCRIAGETETEQSAVDPLDPGTVHHLPLYAHASPRAFVIHPGEAVIIPQVGCIPYKNGWLNLQQACMSGGCGEQVTGCCSAVRQGWWHYAVALDASITVMQNFYHAPSNAAGLVELVLKTAAATKRATANCVQGAQVQ